MNKYILIIAKDWKRAGLLFDSGFRFKVEVSEKNIQEFIQKCYEKKWVILKWL